MFCDYFFIKAFLTKIELVKQLFVLEVEQATIVSIPDDLSQSDLPLSFRYYDPILSHVDQRLSIDAKQYFNLKAQYSLNATRDQNIIFTQAL